MTWGNEEDQEQLTKVVDFTKENWDIFGITDLRSTDFIEAGGSYFKPIASTAQILENPRLAEALLQKTEFVSKLILHNGDFTSRRLQNSTK